MSTYISFFGKSQDFTEKYYDHNGPIHDFNEIIKDFHLMESKTFTVDDIKNKEILARYYFTAEGKTYSLLKLYSFAQALNGNRVAGSIYGVGLISDENINITPDNLALLREAKDAFAKLSLDGLKFNKSDFSVDTDRIWNAIVNSSKGNLLNKLNLSSLVNNRSSEQIAFYVKDLFAEAIKLGNKTINQDTVYFSEDLDHLKRTQNKWGKDHFFIYWEEQNQYVLYKEPVVVPKPTPSDQLGNKASNSNDNIAVLKSELADALYNNKALEQDLNKLKKSSKKKSLLIYCLIGIISLLLIGTTIFFSTKKNKPTSVVVNYIRDSIYVDKSNFTILNDEEIRKVKNIALINSYARCINDFKATDQLSDSVSLNMNFNAIKTLAKPIKFDIRKIEDQYHSKIDSIRLRSTNKVNQP